MKYALIETREGVETIAQLVDSEAECFPVFHTLKWEEVADDTPEDGVRVDGLWGTIDVEGTFTPGKRLTPPAE